MKRKLSVEIILLSILIFSVILVFQQTSLPASAAPNNDEEEKVRFEANLEIEDLNPNGEGGSASFELTNFNWGEVKETNSPDVVPTMLYVEKRVGQYSADLYLACAKKFVLPSATLTVNKGVTDGKLQILEVVFYNLEIAGYDITTINEVKDSPIETLAITFTAIEFTTIWYDEGGVQSSDTELIDYDDTAPVADADGPYSGTVGEAITFDGSASYDNPPGTIEKYQWNFGDDNTLYSTTWPTITHQYDHADTFKVTLQVIDNAGQYSSQDITWSTISAPGS